MPATLSDLRTRFRGWYPEATDAIIDECLNHGLKEVGFLFPAYFRESTVNLTAGTARYAWPADMVFLYTAVYEASSSSRTRLIPVFPEQMGQIDEEWRHHPPSTPTHIIPEGSYMRLWPAPNASTSGGYPVVRLNYTASLPQLANPSDQIDAAVQIEDWLMHVALKRYASQRVKQDFPLREHEERQAYADMQSFLTQRGIDLQSRIVAGRRRRRQI